MAKQKYLTEYPSILMEKAKQTGVKVKKEDYRFLDYFMSVQEEVEYPSVQLELMEESKELMLSFTTCMGEVVHMMMKAHDANEVRFKAKAARIPKSLVDSVGQSILTGRFINNHLAVQITLENIEESFADVVMEGKLWISCLGTDVACECSFYLLMFIEQINQIKHALAEIGYEVQLKNAGPNKVKVIRVVHELTGWGLKEAKDFVQTAPNAIFKVGSKSEALYYCEELLKLGAQAEVV